MKFMSDKADVKFVSGFCTVNIFLRHKCASEVCTSRSEPITIYLLSDNGICLDVFVFCFVHKSAQIFWSSILQVPQKEAIKEWIIYRSKTNTLIEEFPHSHSSWLRDISHARRGIFDDMSYYTLNVTLKCLQKSHTQGSHRGQINKIYKTKMHTQQIVDRTLDQSSPGSSKSFFRWIEFFFLNTTCCGTVPETRIAVHKCN